MQLTYDPRHNIAYLRVRENTTEVETIRVSDALNVDVAPDGTVYGIELLNANEQLQVAVVVIPEGDLERPVRWLRASQDVVVGEPITVRDAFFFRSV